MADHALRQLERAADAGDELARGRLIEERIRHGGRDPRINPRHGDRVAAPKRKADGTTAREVVDVWPKALVSAVVCEGGALLAPGTLVWNVRQGAPREERARVRLQAVRPELASWGPMEAVTEDTVVLRELDTPPEVVSWRWTHERTTYGIQATSITAWRTWAKKAQVLFAYDEEASARIWWDALCPDERFDRVERAFYRLGLFTKEERDREKLTPLDVFRYMAGDRRLICVGDR